MYLNICVRWRNMEDLGSFLPYNHICLLIYSLDVGTCNSNFINKFFSCYFHPFSKSGREMPFPDLCAAFLSNKLYIDRD